MKTYKRSKLTQNPLCFCNALCDVCRCVSNNILQFQSTCTKLQRTISALNLPLSKQWKQDKITLTSHINTPKNVKKSNLKQKPEGKKLQKCLTVGCFQNPNEELLKQNILLNQYFDTFQQKYRVNKNELEQLKSENTYLRQLINKNINREKCQDNQNNIEFEESNNNSRISFTKKQVEILKSKLFENEIYKKQNGSAFKETADSFLPSFNKKYKRFPQRDSQALYSEIESQTPSKRCRESFKFKFDKD